MILILGLGSIHMHPKWTIPWKRRAIRKNVSTTLGEQRIALILLQKAPSLPHRCTIYCLPFDRLLASNIGITLIGLLLFIVDVYAKLPIVLNSIL